MGQLRMSSNNTFFVAPPPFKVYIDTFQIPFGLLYDVGIGLSAKTGKIHRCYRVMII